MKKNSKNITTDDLAIMIQKSFNHSSTELQEVKRDLEIRLDRIENLLISSINNRLDRLEDKMLKVEATIGK